MLDRLAEILEDLSQDQYARYFLSKNYSLEMLMLLYRNEGIDGVEELYRALKTPTPKYPAFLSYIKLLESKNCIVRYESIEKKSKKFICLTEICRTAIDRIMVIESR